MKNYEELFALAKQLKEAATADEIDEPLKAIEAVVTEVGRSFSGSWLGYHSRVYYADLAPTPPGAHFSQEWGLGSRLSSLGSRGDWQEFDPEEVKSYIYQTAGNPDLTEAKKLAGDSVALFDSAKSDIMSILENELADKPDGFLAKLKAELESLEPASSWEVKQRLSPKGQIMTRDTIVLGQGNKIPPHIDVAAEVIVIRSAFELCKSAANISTKAASHLERKSKRQKASERIGTNVFIGHGRSTAWRELKDFVQDRLGLPWDEFNRVPVAGVTNIARLSEMLDAAAIAFLVMTAEDEMADGDIQARMNVIHEAGLFQGRLGFTKAIVLLEVGCAEFSNIQGLGQIRFPKGNVAASFEEIRKVLEREGLLNEDS
jgi:predicted nucleotide-binding protein